MSPPSDPALVGRRRHGDAFDRPADLIIAELAARQHGRVATWQLTGLVSRDELRRRVGSGHLHRVLRGVYAVGHQGATPDARRMAAVLACGPRALLSHRSLCHHLALLDGPGSSIVDVTAAGRTRVGRPGLRLHLPRELLRNEATTVRAIPCTTVERLLADMAADATDAELATLVHRAQVKGLLRARPLALQLARPARHIGRLRALVEPVGPDLRGEMERRLHRFVLTGGWPPYAPNVKLWTPAGPLRADALWHDHRFALELDSWAHHADREHFETDRDRVFAADNIGIRLMRVTWRMLAGRPDPLTRALDRHVGRPDSRAGRSRTSR